MEKKKCTYFGSSSLFLRAAAVGTGEGEHLLLCLLGGGTLAHKTSLSTYFLILHEVEEAMWPSRTKTWTWAMLVFHPPFAILKSFCRKTAFSSFSVDALKCAGPFNGGGQWIPHLEISMRKFASPCVETLLHWNITHLTSALIMKKCIGLWFAFLLSFIFLLVQKQNELTEWHLVGAPQTSTTISAVAEKNAPDTIGFEINDLRNFYNMMLDT